MKIQELIERINSIPESVTAVVFLKLEDRKTASDEDIKQLLQTLLNKGCNTIQHLDLSDYKLNSQHIALISRLLSQSGTLEYLYMDNTGLGDRELSGEPSAKTSVEALDILFDGLSQNTCLLIFTLEENEDIVYLSVDRVNRLNTIIQKHPTLINVYLESNVIFQETSSVLEQRRDVYFSGIECIRKDDFFADIQSLILPENIIPCRAFVRLVIVLGNSLTYCRDERDVSMRLLTVPLEGQPQSSAVTIIRKRSYFVHGHVYQYWLDKSMDDVQILETIEEIKKCLALLSDEQLEKIRMNFPRIHLKRRKNIWTDKRIPTANKIIKSLRQTCNIAEKEAGEFIRLIGQLGFLQVIRKKEIMEDMCTVKKVLENLDSIKMLALEESVRRFCQFIKDRDKYILVQINRADSDFSKLLQSHIDEETHSLIEIEERAIERLKYEREFLSHGRGSLQKKPELILGLTVAIQANYFTNIKTRMEHCLEPNKLEKFQCIYEQWYLQQVKDDNIGQEPLKKKVRSEGTQDQEGKHESDKEEVPYQTGNERASLFGFKK